MLRKWNFLCWRKIWANAGVIWSFFGWVGDYNRYVKYAVHLSPSASRDGDINAISSWTEAFYGYFHPYLWQAFLLDIVILTLKKLLGKMRAWLADMGKDLGKKLGLLHQFQCKEHGWQCVLICTKGVWAWNGSVSWYLQGQLGSESVMCLGDGKYELWPLVF